MKLKDMYEKFNLNQILFLILMLNGPDFKKFINQGKRILVILMQITAGIMYCGYNNDLLDPLKIRRARFLLILMENVPDTMNTANETLDDEEVWVNGIYRRPSSTDKKLTKDLRPVQQSKPC
ncbi:hypothetical protein Glove_117g329 [Diversispora epigaea]|uniref:Uncharacterized protein n=1 Tax=Diversispora epigaea TaxID=1348612 RepID=A0A397J0S1_9GLOM|nr:hypothetical protein Glove_117g329 [Diversispora epigaea]